MPRKKNLKKKAASGMIWTTIQKFSKMGIQFISGIVLARLLTPYDYGCIGMLTVFITFADSFIDGGFGAALIQKKKPTQADYSTVFHWNLFLAVIFYIAVFLSAPAIARFYKIPVLCDVLRVQGIILFIYAIDDRTAGFFLLHTHSFPTAGQPYSSRALRSSKLPCGNASISVPLLLIR